MIAEALTNAAKHARASAVSVRAGVTGEVLVVIVRDDGTGGADPIRGTGLVGLKDRVEALGGRLLIESPSGKGTTLRAELPLTASGEPVGLQPAQRASGAVTSRPSGSPRPGPAGRPA